VSDSNLLIAQLTPEKVYSELGSSRRGLKTAEVAARIEKYGENRIPEVKKRSMVLVFLANFYHTFALLLWFSAVLAYIAQMPELCWAIIGVVVINALFSFWQEFKAEKATEALKKLVPQFAKVIRDGEVQQILAVELVPGDLLVLEEGDSISADARLVEEFELRCNNATFTGESEPANRTADAIGKKEITILEAPNFVFSGTSVAAGSGKAVVFATGEETQFGHVAMLTQTVHVDLSPLQKEVNKVALIVAFLAIAVGGALFVAGYSLAKLALADAAIFAIGMIVANVPEGLLPTLSLALATAVQKMVKENALVKKLSSVETLGSATVICTDKTGTLTQNEMTVRKIWTNQEEVDVLGVGYDPTGSFMVGDKALEIADAATRLSAVLKASSFCNNAKLNPPNEDKPGWTILGDPTEAALLVATRKAGFDYIASMETEKRIYELPFESVRKRMSAIHIVRDIGLFPDAKTKAGATHEVAYIKGAPREVLELCTHVLINGKAEKMTDVQRENILERNDAFAMEALRVLAFAYKENPAKEKNYTVESVENNLTFVGLMAMIDPPRPEVEAAVKECQKAHIRVIMITGDYGLTAESIARRIGIVKGDNVRILTGVELDNMETEELDHILKSEQVLFARVAPDHKLLIATRLKEMGEVVAMTGDGVNDAPALKKADIGVAMGIAGTDVAKEAADVILLDDNFATIVNAISEGRAVYDNIKKFIVYIFAHLGPEAIPFIIFILFRTPLPITPMQIIAIDLGTETLPALALGVEKAEPDIMLRPPRSKKDTLLNKGVLLRAYLFIGLIEGALVVLAYFWVLLRSGWHVGTIAPIGSPLMMEASTMSFLAIVATQVGTVVACRTNRESVFKIGFLSNPWIIWGLVFEIGITAFLIYIPPVAKFFGMFPLGVRDWLFVLPFPFIVFFAEEGRKWFVRRREASKTSV
jgi:P-type Ca2+ transporter type 2C